MKLLNKKCVPCEGGTLALRNDEIQKYISELQQPWKVLDNKKITHTFTFKNFKSAMQFTNAVSDIAENEGHHPDIHIFYNKVQIDLWTHAIGGLSENDFIVAAKIEKINQ